MEDAEPVNGEACGPGRGRGCRAPGGGGAAGNVEPSLSIRNDFFLINRKCHFSHQICPGPTGGCCLCLALSLLFWLQWKLPRRWRLWRVCASHRGDGFFSCVSMRVCLQPASDRQGRDVIARCAKWKASSDQALPRGN